uniref:Uncharacterized protein n=1 Tax=Setaria viridis TaxID=4556 RepID=A0A4U6SRE3_SETVI|nr:leucine-rich repeat extensin-like protein 5 [Setaria viridis]TKV90588.1 hypothetical protein SEVIR_9G039201v2 [Setaria viridis]
MRRRPGPPRLPVSLGLPSPSTTSRRLPSPTPGLKSSPHPFLSPEMAGQPSISPGSPFRSSPGPIKVAIDLSRSSSFRFPTHPPLSRTATPPPVLSPVKFLFFSDNVTFAEEQVQEQPPFEEEYSQFAEEEACDDGEFFDDFEEF